MRNKTFKCATS